MNRKDESVTVEAKYLSRDAFADRVRKVPAVILPLGATEQHGHHLPLGVDMFLAEALAIRIAKKTGATVMPTMPFGYSWVWCDSPGTITLKTSTIENVIVETAESLAKNGVRHLFLVSGHEANGAAMKQGSRRLRDNPDISVWRLFYPDLSTVMSSHCASKSWHGIVHACEFETSLMLAVKPHLVDMKKACREYPEHDNGYFFGATPMGDLSKSGVFGDATQATAQKGEAMIDAFVERMVRIMRDALAEPAMMP